MDARSIRSCILALPIATALFFVSVAASSGQTQMPECQASVFVLQNLEKQATVPSPDAQKRVVMSMRSEDDGDGVLRVYAEAREIGNFALHRLSGGVFVKWSPDSQAFFLMWSNGGMIGGYELRVFRVAGDKVTELPSSATAESEFERQHPCRDRGHNVFAIRWLDGSSRLLLALQVYPTSDCGKEMGLFAGYEVRAVDGAVLRRYTEPQLKGVWPPGCPTAFYPTGFWSADDLEQAQKAMKERQPIKK